MGIENDRISLTSGRLTVNGEIAADGATERFGDRQALLDLARGGGPNIDDLTVPEGSVLVLGDNRGDSLDGRYFGLLPQEALYGRAIGIYYRRGAGLVWRSL